MHALLANPIGLLTLVLAISHAAIQQDLFDSTTQDEMWSRWKLMHAKQYADHQEEGRRRGAWMKNVVEVMHHNVKYDLGLETYSMGLNEFSDLSWEEFSARYLTGWFEADDLGSEDHAALLNTGEKMNAPPPPRQDWRNSDWVNSVVHQGNCGSSYAFAAVGAIEGQFAKRAHVLVELSKQQIIDCSTAYGNNGCSGGTNRRTLEYLQHNGSMPESAYPYMAKTGKCHFEQMKQYTKVKTYTILPEGNELALQTAVGTYGPVAVAVHAEAQFHLYKSGIYQSATCDPKNLTHSVLIIGYDTADSSDYWILKNSWGLTWGMNGYMNLARNKANMCGVATRALCPEVV